MSRRGVVASYREKVADGHIEADQAQIAAAERLDALAAALDARAASMRGLMARLRKHNPPAVRGVYIHGAVGRGKSMLMDLFYDEVAFKPKRRSHFHEFMAETHERLAVARKTASGDPVLQVASEIAAGAGLICFDELHVTDIADAMILGRLFKVLFASGVTFVATSNARPDELYKNGLNRQLFLPFIDLIEDNMDVVELKSAKDFRLDKLYGRQLYFAPLGAAATAELDAHWDRLTGHDAGAATELEVKGRRLPVPRAAMGVARFHFADLCERPLGAADYLQIAHAFHTIIIDGIPVLGPHRRDVARRFINLIDTLYDNRVCLIASAEAEPVALYPKGDGAELFQRTVSRLTEMRSEAYLEGRALRASTQPAPAP